jgi:hypothetical protein
MIKQYPKTYEDIYSRDTPGNLRKLNEKNISINGYELDEYISLFRSSLREASVALFDTVVKVSWLRKRFVYYGESHLSRKKKKWSPLHCFGFSKFTRRLVGSDIQIIFRSTFFEYIEPYLETFFPGFDEGNPFENPDYYKFPFKNITIDFLPVVYQLDERFELLKIADERKMSYAVFLDYIINHVYSINEELGRDRYQVSERNWIRLFYIKDTDKKKIK